MLRLSGTTPMVRSTPASERTRTESSRSGRRLTIRNRSSQVSMGRLSMLTMRSPTPKPACSATESASTLPTTGGASSNAGTSAPW